MSVGEPTAAAFSSAPLLVVFDLGGTTIRDRGEVPAAFASALDASRLSFDHHAVATWRGASKREVLERLIAEQRPSLGASERAALVASTYARFRAELIGRLEGSGDLALPEALPTFERLRSAGIRVAVNTGFDGEIVQTILGAVGWTKGVLDAVVAGDDVSLGRPAPFMIFRAMEQTAITDVRRVAVVGDTRLDLEAGANAGVAYRIGVTTGAHDHATLASAPHTHIFDSLAQVRALWLGDAR